MNKLLCTMLVLVCGCGAVGDPAAAGGADVPAPVACTGGVQDAKCSGTIRTWCEDGAARTQNCAALMVGAYCAIADGAAHCMGPSKPTNTCSAGKMSTVCKAEWEAMHQAACAKQFTGCCNQKMSLACGRQKEKDISECVDNKLASGC